MIRNSSNSLEPQDQKSGEGEEDGVERPQVAPSSQILPSLTDHVRKQPPGIRVLSKQRGICVNLVR